MVRQFLEKISIIIYIKAIYLNNFKKYQLFILLKGIDTNLTRLRLIHLNILIVKHIRFTLLKRLIRKNVV